MLALDGDLAQKSVREIALDLFEASRIEGVWDDGLAERGTARRRIEKVRALLERDWRDLVTGRAKPWRTPRVAGGQPRKAAKARVSTPPLDPGWLSDPRDDGHEAAAPDGRRHLGATAAAAYVGLSTRTLRRMRREERGPPCARKGRRITYDVRDLDDWMRTRT